MMFFRIGFIVVSFLALALNGLNCKSKPNNQNMSQDNIIELKKGEVYSFSVSELASAGYIWQIIENDSAITKIDDSVEKIDTKTTIGGPMKKTYQIKGLKKGTSTIKLIYSRPWEKNIAPADSVAYTVKVM